MLFSPFLKRSANYAPIRFFIIPHDVYRKKRINAGNYGKIANKLVYKVNLELQSVTANKCYFSKSKPQSTDQKGTISFQQTYTQTNKLYTLFKLQPDQFSQ